MVQMTFLSVGLQWISPSLVDTGSLDTGYDASPVQSLKPGAHKHQSRVLEGKVTGGLENVQSKGRAEREEDPTEAMPQVLGGSGWMLSDPVLPLPGKTMPLPAGEDHRPYLCITRFAWVFSARQGSPS